MEETKIKRFKWLFVLKGGVSTNAESKFDYSTGKWFSEPNFSNNTISFIGTKEEISEFYDELIDNAICVQDDYNMGEYEGQNT